MMKRLLALFVALMMVAALPVTVLADDGDDGGGEKKPPIQLEDKESNIQRVEISTTTATVRVNQKRTLTAEAIPFTSRNTSKYAYYWNEEIYWSSSNPEVATVNGDGIVTGVSPGTAVITAKAAQNDKYATCVVTVPGTAVQGLQQETTANKENPGADSGEILSAATLRADVETAVKNAAASSTATVTYEDKTTLSTTALRGAAYIAELNGGEVRVRLATTMVEESSDEVVFYSGDKPPASYQGYLQINPALAGDEDVNLGVAVYTSADKIGETASKARSTFGSNAAVVQLSQKGAFGFSVTVGAKVDLSGLDTSNLKVYAFDAETGAYSSVNTTCTVNANGYVVFAARQGGAFVITDKSL